MVKYLDKLSDISWLIFFIYFWMPHSELCVSCCMSHGEYCRFFVRFCSMVNCILRSYIICASTKYY